MGGINMNQVEIELNNEVEISNLFSSELQNAFKIILSKVPFRKMGPLLIDEIICLLKMVPEISEDFTSQELDLINNRLDILFHILVECIVGDSTYKAKVIEYKQKYYKQ